MSKFFAVFLPIFAVIITTLVILPMQKRTLGVNKKTMILLLGVGILVFLWVAGVFGRLF